MSITEWLAENGFEAIKRYNSMQVEIYKNNTKVCTIKAKDIQESNTEEKLKSLLSKKLNINK